MFCVLERRTRKVQGGGGNRQLAAVAAPDVKHNLRQTPAQRDHGDGGRLQHCDRRREQSGFSPSAQVYEQAVSYVDGDGWWNCLHILEDLPTR